MLATRANKNEREQLGSGYVSEIKMKFLPKSCSSKYVINLAAKKWEREISWNQTWAKIQWKPEQECVRGSVSECVSMRELNTPLGPYLKRRWRVHQRRCKPQWLWSRWRRWAQEQLALGRPTCGVGWPKGGPPGAPLRPGASSMIKFFENMVHGQKFARKDIQLIFPKGF